MLRVFFLILLGALIFPQICLGDARVVQNFTGSDSKTSTSMFTVGDKWELIWRSMLPLNLTLRSSDGTVVAGVRGSHGAIYQPKGGSFYIQIEQTQSLPSSMPPNSPLMNWHLSVVDITEGTTLSATDYATVLGEPGSTGNNAPNPGTQAITYVPPDMVAPNTNPAPASGISSPSPITSATATEASKSPSPPPVPPTPTTSVTMDAEKARAVVLIRGDRAEGTGFLVKTPDGPVVVTNIHVITDNPNIKVSTTSGAKIKVLSTRCASDRDLAELLIQDAGYSYLELATDVSKTAQTGDALITPGNSQGGEVMLNTGGKLLGIGPERVEFDNPIYHGNSGGPIFHSQSGKVLGVVTEAIKVDMTNDLDKTSFANRNSAISGSMRYFGLRLDTVPSWIPIDQARFDIEGTFLEQFHQESRALDAYLNTDKDHIDPDIADLYHKNDRIMRANDTYVQQISGADTSQKFDALKSLIFDIQGVVDQNYDQIQNLNNFYSFNQSRAQDEFEYRKALKDELTSISNNLDRWKGTPHASN